MRLSEEKHWKSVEMQIFVHNNSGENDDNDNYAQISLEIHGIFAIEFA